MRRCALPVCVSPAVFPTTESFDIRHAWELDLRQCRAWRIDKYNLESYSWPCTRSATTFARMETVPVGNGENNRMEAFLPLSMLGLSSLGDMV